MKLIHLFVPGDQPQKIKKAFSSACEVVILDLEDSVADDQKPNARQIISDSLTTAEKLKTRPEIWVRCNGVNSDPFNDDATLLRKIRPDGVMIAKCESAEQIHKVAAAVSKAALIPLLESARGVVSLKEIASASDRIKRVAFGSVDFALDLGVEWSEQGEERKYAMGQIVLESRAAGLPAPLDAVFPRWDDEAAFTKDALSALQMGFFGKMLIHPNQIEWLKKAYAPDSEKVQWAHRVVEAFDESEGAAVSIDGKLIDLPVAELARKILRTADFQQGPEN